QHTMDRAVRQPLSRTSATCVARGKRARGKIGARSAGGRGRHCPRAWGEESALPISRGAVRSHQSFSAREGAKPAYPPWRLALFGTQSEYEALAVENTGSLQEPKHECRRAGQDHHRPEKPMRILG